MIVNTQLQQISALFFVFCAFFYATDVAAQGNAPVISNTGSAAINYQEGSEPVALSPNIIIEDNDSQNMLSATFAFGGNYDSGQDTLLFTATDNVTSHFDETSGTLRLLSVSASQGATIAQMRNAMASVRYGLTTENPGNRAVTINLNVTDIDGNASNTASRTVNVSGINNPPVIRSDSDNTYSEDATNETIRIFNRVNITDVDGTQITRVEIEIESGFNSSEDFLFIQGNDGGLTREVVSDNRIVLTGNATINTYENVIRSFYYRHQPFFFRSPGTRRITLKVFDENNAESNVLARFLIVRPIIGAADNFPPALDNFSVETGTNTDYTFDSDNFNESFNDPNGVNLNGIIITSLPQQGTLFLGSNPINNQFIINRTIISSDQISSLRYSPSNGFTGTDEFRWNATDQENFAANDASVNVRVLPVNQPPVLNQPANADAEEDDITAISGIRLSDPNNDILRVRVFVNNGILFLTPGAVEDELINFITGTQNGEADIVFTAPANLAAFALSGLSYQPNEGFSGNDQLNIEVDDNNGGTASGNTILSIIVINDAPVLANLESDPIEFEEGDDPVIITSAMSVTDEENNQIISATVSITEGFAPDQDILSFSNQGSNVQGNYDQNSGVLSLTGTAQTQVYQNILRSVTYANESQDPSEANRVVSFTVTDNGSPNETSEPVNRTVEVSPVNNPPVLANLEEAPISYDILDNDPVSITNAITISDPDNNNMARVVIAFEEGYDEDEDILSFSPIGNITANWDEDEGVLTLSGGGTLAQYQQAIRSVTYQNNGEDVDDDAKEISITISDGNDNSNTVTREILIITNDPPVVTSFDRTINEDEALTFTIEDFPYEDPDNAPSEGLQSIAITSLPENGVLIVGEDTITVEDVSNSNNGFGISAAQIGELRYVPTPNYFGTDSFGWNAFDGAEYAEENATVNISITSQPDAPVPGDFAVTTAEDQAFTFSAEQFANAATYPDGDALSSIVIRSVPQNGTLLINNISLPVNSELSLQEINSLVYRPAENFNGNDSFNWAASSGELTSEASATVSIEITPVNDPPIINSFTKAINQDEASFTFAASDFTDNYLDVENTPLSFIQITSLPGSGSLLLDGTPIEAGTQINAENISNLTYQAAPDQEVGIVSFGWNASDGQNLSLEEAQVTIIIGTGVTDFSITTDEDTEFSFRNTLFASNYGNPEASLQSIRIESLPTNGTLLLDGENVSVDQEINSGAINQLSYVPAENYSGEDSFGWNASGGDAYAPNAAQVLITINAVNDLPVIEAIADLTLLSGASTDPITVNISDEETAAEDLILTVTSSDNSIIPNDQIVLGGNGASRTITLTSLADTQGEVVITAQVSDGEGQALQQFTVSVVPYLVSFEVQEVLDLCPDQTESISIDIEGGEGPYTLLTECDQENCELELSNGSIIVNPSVYTTYIISLLDANNIRSNVDTLTVNIIDCTNIELDIPTAFTPDGDQVNDLWEIENIEFATNVVVEVYNRYGEQVFRSEGYQQAWDGSRENAMLPVGTYYYVISLDGGLQSYKGSVTILR